MKPKHRRKLPGTTFAALVATLGLALGLLPAGAVASVPYLERDEARSFIRELVERHGFEEETLVAAMAQARHEPEVIRLISPPTRSGVRSWQKYRARFLDRARIEAGLGFWAENAADLQRAADRYGVPAEIIVAIIGVETVYGRNTGNFETLSALATLAFDYPPRAALFRRELEALFLLAREQGRTPGSYYGSYAGALGYPQFLPSSLRSFGVDFDTDGQVSFDATPTDAIGSVANFLHQHGWQPGAPIAERARFTMVTDPAPFIAAGIEPALEPEALSAAGITTVQGQAPAATATLVDLETPGTSTAYWLGYRNFYVLTRYNRSSFYAMSVFELAETLRARRAPRPAQDRITE
jgi:membrane-bound lytic murein transglycosylase B